MKIENEQELSEECKKLNAIGAEWPDIAAGIKEVDSHMDS